MRTELVDITDKQVFKHIGSRLREIREHIGLSDSDIEEKTGISGDSLSKLEEGKSLIHAAHILRLSACYNITPNELFIGLPGLEGRDVSQDDVNHLMENFLKVDQPNRGQLFKDFVASVKAKD